LSLCSTLFPYTTLFRSFLYLNQINFGDARYGVEEASLYYFNKHVWDLDLGEAAILAGLPQSPSRINPRRHPDRAKRRQAYVLDRSEEHTSELQSLRHLV